MSDQTPNNLFESYLNLASKIGNRFPIPGASIDESIHEARIALWRAANTFDPTRGTFEGFASIVIRNHLRNVFDRAKRTSVEMATLDSLSVSNNEEGCEKENIPAREADPLLDAERADIRKAIGQSLELLTASQRELLERFAAGESYADIGREKGVSPAAIRQMLMRALERIRPDLESKSIDVRFLPWHPPAADAHIDSTLPTLDAQSPHPPSSFGLIGCVLLILLFWVAVQITIHLVRFVSDLNN